MVDQFWTCTIFIDHISSTNLQWLTHSGFISFQYPWIRNGRNFSVQQTWIEKPQSFFNLVTFCNTGIKATSWLILAKQLINTWNNKCKIYSKLAFYFSGKKININEEEKKKKIYLHFNLKSKLDNNYNEIYYYFFLLVVGFVVDCRLC